jgi:hypothetical protein
MNAERLAPVLSLTLETENAPGLLKELVFQILDSMPFKRKEVIVFTDS